MPAPKPKNKFGHPRTLCPSAGARVLRSASELRILVNAGSIKAMLGEYSDDMAFEMLNFFVDSGSNFLDTANSYREEESEKWLREWMELRQDRDDLVLATEYTQLFKAGAKLRYN
ncbi:aryl-alcohol dehydrogenase aad14 [Diplodia corticola]|uniref:Aryl-alcohol dehydrogenase aad14 n=1 Tax=Diplodia corticola TaxID=236234 RepID=A0A1J9R7I5_9PEZI|nr:aryl-alcohol dehydrogenase aad14 [Diplodia corticola]OJD36162.1 aryl-alcohol dehydrogenase aad14 [Diplodia corticola]